MSTTILEDLGLKVYEVDGFHEHGALVLDLGAVFVRRDLSPSELARVVAVVVDHLLLPDRGSPRPIA